MSTRVLVVTGADARYEHLLTDFVASYRAMYRRRFPIGLIGYDKSIATHPLREHFDYFVDDSFDYPDFQTQSGFYGAYTASKARIPELFPGYDIYLWVDADCWFCDPNSIDRIVFGATRADIAIHPEYDIHYWKWPTPNSRTIDIYKSIEKEVNPGILQRAMVNSGVYGMAANSPVWTLWHRSLAALRQNSRNRTIYFSDQIPLHKLLHTEPVRVFPLRATENWQLYASAPRIRFKTRDHQHQFEILAPTPPFERIGILHLAGTTKEQIYNVNGIRTKLTYSSIMSALETLKREK